MIFIKIFLFLRRLARLYKKLIRENENQKQIFDVLAYIVNNSIQVSLEEFKEDMNDKEIIQNNYSFAGCCIFINTTKNKFYVEKSDCVSLNLIGHINGEIYNSPVSQDIIDGDDFKLRLIPLSDFVINSLEQAGLLSSPRLSYLEQLELSLIYYHNFRYPRSYNLNKVTITSLK